MNYFRKINYSVLYRILFICIFLLALSSRLIVADITRELILGDETTYHYAAESILNHGTLTREINGDMFNGKAPLEPTSALSPGYPLFIALIYALFDHSTQAVFISQIILSMVAFWLIYRLLCLLHIRKPYILLSLFVAAVYPGFLYNIDRMLTEHLFTTLILAFAYYFLQGMRKGNVYLIAFAALLLGFATHVRAIAFPFAILGVCFLLIYERHNSKQMKRNIVVFCSVIFLSMLPWWIRNGITFNSFIFFTEAGEGAKTWGAVPYFIDMASVNNLSLENILQSTINSNPSVFYNWRIFGFFQYMWGDLWDEKLVHPYPFLRYFIVLQQFLIVPCIAAIPLIVSKCRKEIIFISCIPIAFTFMNMPFHGLPRYVYPALPFVIILAGVMLDKIGGRLRGRRPQIETNDVHLFKWQRISDLWVRRLYLGVSAIFSIVLMYSVYIFAYNINEEMSEYRLSRYMGITSEVLKSSDIISTQTFDATKLSIENVTQEIKNGKMVFTNNVDAPPIMKLKSSLNGDDRKIVTEVELKIQGGYVHDFMTVYWTGEKTPEISENTVYKFPTNRFKGSYKIYIDDDVDSLMIVPAVFRGGSFEVEQIIIKKYHVK